MLAKHEPGASRVEALDLLRLVAVIAVVFFHYGFLGPVPRVAIPAMAGFAQFGFLGVSAFFVISGFVIAYSTEGRTATQFAIARFSRIYPTFLICMTLTFLTVLVLGKPIFTATFAQWASNLIIAAPAIGKPYMDGAYWSLMMEVVFYAWIVVLIAVGVFPRRIDAIIMIWLGITLANELTLHLHLFEKVFIADDSCFFVVGLLIYEFHRGRRDVKLFGLFIISIGTAIFQAVHKFEGLGLHANDAFDKEVVAAICVASIAVIFMATRIRRLPLPPRLVLAVGGLTYPFYLLHMQMGYVIYSSDVAANKTPFSVAAIMLVIAILSWAIWRHVETPLHAWTKRGLTGVANRIGLSKPPTKAISSRDV